MKPERYSCPYAEWEVDQDNGTFWSPSTGRSDQVIIFSDHKVKDGSISGAITAIEGEWNDALGYEFQECALMFRYAVEDRFYIAGMGGFGNKFYIAKSVQYEAPWHLLRSRGSAHDLLKGKTYNLRIEFVGDRMTLYADGAPMLSATDDAYASGLCGLRTNRTKGRFGNVDIELLLKKKCFVIMPFEPKMRRVYSVIQQTVAEHNMICERADDSFVSHTILDQVKAQIESADLIIVDFSGRNPNVYYEAGLADALKKKWIVLAQSKSDLAFDVEHIRAIYYSPKSEDEEQFKSALGRALDQTLGEHS